MHYKLTVQKVNNYFSKFFKILFGVLLRQTGDRPYHFWGTFLLYQDQEPRQS